MSAAVRVRGLTVGPLAENCWLLTDALSHTAILVDPGDEALRLLDAVDESGCALVEIWLTHAHFDHVGAVASILRERPVPVRLHALDEALYTHAATSAARWGISLEQPPASTVRVAEGDVLRFGGDDFAVWHLPGHAPGHVAYISDSLCISGDLLFAGSIGRTDLPWCDPQAMHQSLTRMATLPPGLRVLPGHGEDTTIARELATNPFLRGLARPIGA